MINKKIQHVCFDLDGTLINSYRTIYKTTIKTLEHLKIEGALIELEFQKRIGHHFVDIFRELSIPVTDIEHFISIYKTFYFDFIDDSELYPGLIEVLEELKERGLVISLLTTKGQDQADKIIDHFSLRKYFSYVMGRRFNIPHKPSPEPLILICKELNIPPQESIIIGDTELDINCGKNAGVRTCAVTYGYRTKEILKSESPDFIVYELKEILNFL